MFQLLRQNINNDMGPAAETMVPPHKSKIVCECLKVTEADILKAVRGREIRTVADIIEYTSAGEGCNACHPLLKDYLERQRRKAGKSGD